MFFRKGGLLEGGKQKIANNIKNSMLKEKYENIFPSTDKKGRRKNG